MEKNGKVHKTVPQSMGLTHTRLVRLCVLARLRRMKPPVSNSDSLVVVLRHYSSRSGKMIAGLTTGYSGVVQLSFDNRLFRIQRFNRAKHCKLDKLPFSSQLISTRWSVNRFPKIFSVKCSVSGKANEDIGFEDEFHADPFWLSFIREAFWALRSLLAFLAEQPSQLKYIEWPTFQSTFKTATLTLVLVTLFIISLASIDSALCFLLSVWLRRKA